MSQFVEEIRLTIKDEASAGLVGMTAHLRNFVGGIQSLAAVAGAGMGLGALVKQGIDFNKTMEDSKGGIAGVLLMTRQYADSAGKVVTGQAAMNAAFSEAAVIQEKLKKDALGTAASYTELVQAFQSGLAPAAAAGVTNLEDVREITVMATKAMAALNIPTVQAAQELRGLFSGDTGPDNRLNQALRVTKAELAAVAGDTEKAARLFKDRLGPAASAAAMQMGTLTVRMSNLGDILDQTMGRVTAGIFKEISGGVADLTAWIEKIGPAAETAGNAMWSAFKAGLGPVQELARGVFAALDSRAQASGGTWTEVFQGFAIVVNNVAGYVRTGWGAMFAAMMHPLDTLRLLFGTTMMAIFRSLASAAEAVGMDTFAENLRGAADAADDWGSKSNAFLSETEAAAKRSEDAWRANEAAILGMGAATKKVSSDPTSNPKDLLNSAAGAALHFGQVWATESAKATASFQKFLGGFASFTGDTVGEAIAKIEDEYRDLVGQLGQLMFQAKVPFSKGLAMLETLAVEKGRKITGAIFNGEAAVEDFISVFEAGLTKNNAKLGVSVGMAAAFAAIPGAAESAANAVTGIWQGMARSFDDSFYSVLTGRLDSLKDVFKNLWESILHTFSGYLSDMLQRWIATQMKMGASGQLKALPGATTYGADGTTATYTSGGLPQSGWGGAAAGAGIGLGFGSIIGQFGNGKYNQTGGMIGGALGGAIGGSGALAGMGLGAWAGPIGAIVGALIGTLIGALLSPNTMQHVKGSLGAMVSQREWIPDAWVSPVVSGGGPRIPGQEWTPPVHGDPEFVPAHWYKGGAAAAELEVAGKAILDTQTATFADLFRLGAKEQSRDLLAAYRNTLKLSLQLGNFDINAGSSATIQDVTTYLTTKLIPRIGLSAAFGQVGYLPPGNQDSRGGVGNFSWRAPGMDGNGQWSDKKLFSEDSPLFKMMVGIKNASGAYADGLGFTVEKFAELAERISTDDPAKLLAYITGIVGVVVGLRDLGGEMGKTFAELKQGWDDEAAGGPTASISEKALSIAELFDNLDLYSGDEQLKKAQEAQAASDQLWQSVVSYLQQLANLADKLSAGLQGMRERMRAFLNPLSEGGANAANQATIDGVWGKLLTATNPGQIESATSEAAAAIEALFNVLAERVTRGKALIERVNGLIGQLGSLRADVAFAQLEQSNPLAAWGQEMVEMQTKIRISARLTGLDQIAALEDVGASAEEMYQNLKGFLADIANVSASINKSIDSQIWELGVGEMDPRGQASAVTDRIRELQEQLKIATSPSEIAAIMAEVQSLTGRYIGQFEKDDPKRAEAIAWAQKQLDDSRNIANAALDLLRTQAEAYATELQGIIASSVTMLSRNVSGAATVINELSFTLSELNRVVREQLEALGTAALDSLDPLRLAMEGAAGIFTGATGEVVDAFTAPEVGLEDSAKRVSGAFDLAGAAIGRFIAKIDAANVNGAEAPASKQTTGGPAPVSTDQIIATVRRYGRLTTPRVA